MKTNSIILSLFCVLLLAACAKYDNKASSNNTTTTNPTDPGGSSGNSGSGPIIISYTSTAPCAPSNEKFTFTCSGSAVPSDAQFEWYFGDGNAAYTNPATNAYQDGGYKTVLVKVKKNGSDIGQQTMSVKTYGQDVTPIASFSYTPTTQVGTKQTYEFQSNSWISKGSAQYTWDFGDGSTGGDIKTTHTYQQKPVEQKFDVKLTVTSDAGCNSTKTIQITVPPAFDISGGFTATSTSPCLPSKEVWTFTGPAANVPSGATYAWDFGDGSGQTLGNPVTKSYVNSNSYNVILTIIYNGKDIYKVGQPIHTYGQDATPVASFYLQNTSTTATSITYNLNNTSQVNGGFSNINWAWDFGDGTNSSGVLPNVDKTYPRDAAVNKTYTVKMTVTANSGCSAMATTTVTIPKQ